ncbi:MAG: ADP compounds hydrolase NudE [Kangiella sp.]|nr:MAG: ADP compounds hydrolase NudE [Kangiella sp.]
MNKKPEITRIKEIARTRLFKVEELDLTFSNGEKRTYERLVAGPRGAVMIVPILDDKYFVMIKEYSAGTEDYQLAFPKGLMEEGESVFESANRELKEEVGYGASKMISMKEMSLAPGYLTHKMNLVLAESLYKEELEGDEPEPLEIILFPLSEINKILEHENFTEARSVAALFLANKILSDRKNKL